MNPKELLTNLMKKGEEKYIVHTSTTKLHGSTHA